MKRFHVSKNLWGVTIVQGGVGDNGDLINNSTRVRGEYIPVQPETQYTISCNKSIRTIYAYNNQAKVNVIYKNSLQRMTIPFRTPANCDSICVGFMNDPNTADLSPSDIEFVMLNLGSTALPYEPYGNTWQTKSPPRYGTATDNITSFPATVIPDGTNASADIIGNMVQSGTPSPSSPITPSECGDLTVNLCDESTLQNGYFDTTTNYQYYPNDNYRCFSMSLPAGTYTIFAKSDSLTIRLLRVSSASLGANSVNLDNRAYTFTLSATETIYVSLRNSTTTNDFTGLTIMLNSGETALPYEPCGQHKIPILSGNITTNVYMGEVASARRIKKLVLTGGETWQDYHGANVTRYNLSPIVSDGIPLSTMICSHFKFGGFTATGGNAGEITGTESTTLFRIFFWSDINAVAAWKTYLQQQYTNGTPVTVWYVLAESATGIVNEPLRKIGDYADSVSAANIPTTSGSQQFDVDTTLKPSEVDLTYHGWHRKEPKERVNGSWE